MLGERLVQLAQSASKQVMLVAPFMTREPLTRILHHIGNDVEVTCVTRWRVEEIASGHSDPEIWIELRARHAGLLLRDDLHAKAYLFDDVCLVGSANLTDTALGWRDPANLEVLIEIDRSTPEIAVLEAAIDEQAVEVDDQLFDAVVEAVAAFVASLRHRTHSEVLLENDLPVAWLPRLRSPESLFEAYCGRALELTAAARDTAEADLAVLRIPPGLERSSFERAVAVKLLQVPLIAGVDRLVVKPRRFGEVREYLARHGAEDQRDWESAWQTLIRWLRHFMPQRYVLSVPNVSEIMMRQDALERILGRSDS